ncbi:MAG: Secretion system C-terminal sorting domain, partial [Bacteroidota bacterium]
NNTLVVFPNPCNNFFELRFSLPETENNLQIAIFNLLGQKLRDIKITNCKIGQNNFSINCEQLLSGVYQLQLITKSGILNKQIVIQ